MKRIHPTRKQRRKMQYLRKMTHRPAVCVVDGVLVWARDVSAGETFTITPGQLSMAVRRPVPYWPKPFAPKSYFSEDEPVEGKMVKP